MMRATLILIVAMLALVGLSQAQTPQADVTRQIGIQQMLGNRVPADAVFRDEYGKTIRFGDLLGKRPLVVAPIWYQCTTACMVVQDSLMKTLAKATKGDRLIVGRDMDVVFVSINPKETPDLALRKKNVLTSLYKRPESDAGWHFLTGDDANIHKVTDALGFRYTYDPQTDRINHSVGIMFVSPQGTVSSYILGADYPTEVMADNLKRAERNEVGPKADTVLLGCIMIDPLTGKRSLVIENVVRLAAFIFMLGVFGWVGSMIVASKKQALKCAVVGVSGVSGNTDNQQPTTNNEGGKRAL